MLKKKNFKMSTKILIRQSHEENLSSVYMTHELHPNTPSDDNVKLLKILHLIHHQT